MAEHVTGLTEFVNHYLGQFALALLSWLHIKPENREIPIPEHVVMGFLVLIIGTLLAFLLRSRLSVERPGGFQQVAELFILLANLFSVFPLFAAPTANVSVPLACAILTFLYFNWQGIRHHGHIAYLKHFAGPVPLLSPLIFPVEIISTCARVLSLTVRLWANIFASDLLYSIFLSLLLAPALWGWNKAPVLGIVLAVFPALIPLLFIGLHIFVAIIQTYIFTVLPSVYLGIATGEEH